MSTIVETTLPDLNTAASIRKIRKPLIERKRRERINSSMEQLKSIVLQSLDKNEEEFSKMEKADILEMTVQFLKNVPKYRDTQKQRATVGPTGYNICAEETRRYLSAQSRPLEAQQTYNNIVKPVARVGGYQTSSLPTQSVAHQATSPLTKPSHLNTVNEMKYKFLHADPSLMKPLSIMVPSERKPNTMWRPW